MRNLINSLLVTISVLLLGCGFKPLNYKSNFKIIDIQSSGDSKINFILKNKINKNLNKKEPINIVKLMIDSNKSKIIKEKNIQNEVTKYSLIVSVNVNYHLEGRTNIKEFKVTKSTDFTVATNYSQTLTNEKNAIYLLVSNIADDINKKLLLNLSDI